MSLINTNEQKLKVRMVLVTNIFIKELILMKLQIYQQKKQVTMLLQNIELVLRLVWMKTICMNGFVGERNLMANELIEKVLIIVIKRRCGQNEEKQVRPVLLVKTRFI
jgi:hypothetical protein